MPRVADPQTAALWRRRLQRFASSGLTAAEFCRRESVSVSALYLWRRKLADAAAPPATPTECRPESTQHSEPSRPEFLPVQLLGQAPAELRIGLPGGVQLALAAVDRQLVVDVVETLAAKTIAAAGDDEPNVSRYGDL